MLATLLDRTDGDAVPLPASLAERYGGELRFPSDSTHVFANFVSTIDGIVSFDRPGVERAKQISRGHPGDLFVLALLRAIADAIVVGAGTVRKEPGIWTSESVFPEAAADFAGLRRAMRKRERPLTVIVTASGELDLALPALVEGAPVLVLTTSRGAARLAKAPRHITVRALASTSPDAVVRESITASGGRHILTEGGPSLLAQFVRDRVLDELFLTVAPRLAGRSEDERRLALVEGVAFGPSDAPTHRLQSVKEAGDYLFLRFARL